MGFLDFIKRKANVPDANNIDAIWITLQVTDKPVLFVMLAAEGSINRLGTGAEDNSENDLFIGITPPDLFASLVNRVNADLLKWIGQYAHPAPKGKICELIVGFKKADGKESISFWRYGTESSGPSPEICNFVNTAVEVTGPWYEQQKRMVRGT